MVTYWYKKLDESVSVPLDSQSIAKARLQTYGMNVRAMASMGEELSIVRFGDGWSHKEGSVG